MNNSLTTDSEMNDDDNLAHGSLPGRSHYAPDIYSPEFLQTLLGDLNAEVKIKVFTHYLSVISGVDVRFERSELKNGVYFSSVEPRLSLDTIDFGMRENDLSVMGASGFDRLELAREIDSFLIALETSGMSMQDIDVSGQVKSQQVGYTVDDPRFLQALFLPEEPFKDGGTKTLFINYLSMYPGVSITSGAWQIKHSGIWHNGMSSLVVSHSPGDVRKHHFSVSSNDVFDSKRLLEARIKEFIEELIDSDIPLSSIQE